ncbi:MAG: DUF882 domain-containing protein [Gemmatimonadetes bacterium]|nr:DUF882 domain-containing protein [Gemmatimonadota bacterium]
MEDHRSRGYRGESYRSIGHHITAIGSLDILHDRATHKSLIHGALCHPDIQESLGSNGTYEVISTYRSPKTNEILRASGANVARNSQHLLGRAIECDCSYAERGMRRDSCKGMACGRSNSPFAARPSAFLLSA